MTKQNLQNNKEVHHLLTDSLRKGLFTETPDDKRTFFKSMELEVSNWQTVVYTGEELNQDDLKVWDALVKMARKMPRKADKDITCQFRAADFLKKLKRPASPEERIKLHDSLVRLTATTVQVVRQNQLMMCPLVECVGTLPSGPIKFNPPLTYVIKPCASMIALLGKPAP